MATETHNQLGEEPTANELAFPIFHSMSPSELVRWNEFVIEYKKMASQYITVKFFGPNQHSGSIKIKRGECFKKAMTQYANLIGVKLSQLLFGLREHVLNPAVDMPLSCNCQDNDTIHVYFIRRKYKSVPDLHEQDVADGPADSNCKDAA